jgi:hypothetical protein
MLSPALTATVTVSPGAPEPECRTLFPKTSLTSKTASSPHGCPGPSTSPTNARVQANPVTPARRSASADAKASRQHDANGRPYRSFGCLLAHLGTLTRNQLQIAGAPAEIPVLTEPTSEQRQAFDLIGVPIPLTPAGAARTDTARTSETAGQRRSQHQNQP